jgi:uncharacterized protein (TIGR02594 family)
MRARVTATKGLNIRQPFEPGEKITAVPCGTVLEVAPVPWYEVTLADGTRGWASSKYLEEATGQEAVAPSPPPISPVAAGGREPPWLVWARSKLGIHEVSGAGDNAEIVSWFRFTTLAREFWHDATAWCSVFVNAAFGLNGIKGCGSARAVDWLGWGQRVETPYPGCVTVFKWADGGHHVALFLKGENGRVQVLGGNQSNAVTITWFPEASIMGYRAPA